jgi:hypothetical protein
LKNSKEVDYNKGHPDDIDSTKVEQQNPLNPPNQHNSKNLTQVPYYNVKVKITSFG